MQLDTMVDSLDNVPEAVREAYTEKDGKFTLNVKPINGLELANVGDMRKALESERATATASGKELAALKKTYGDLDADAARAAIKKIEELGDDADIEAKVAGLLEQRESQLSKKFETEAEKLKGDLNTEREQLTTRNKALKTQLEHAMLRTEAMQAITAENGRAPLLMPVINSMTQMKENEDGTFTVVVLDPDTGNERLSTKSGSSELMSIRELVAELKNNKDYGVAFNGSDTSGGGSSGTNPGSGSGGKIIISPADAKDHSKYKAAKAKAEKDGVPLVIQ